MKAATDTLTAVGGELYAEAQKAAQPAGTAGHTGPDGDEGSSARHADAEKKPEKKADVVDADFEVVDEEKKK